MKRKEALEVRYVDDDSWLKELCPECGARLLGLAAWRDHGPRHGWGSEWLAARIRAALPGEKVMVDPRLLEGTAPVEMGRVEDATWKSGIER